MIEPPRGLTPEEAFELMLFVFGMWFIFCVAVGLWWPIR